MNGCQSKSIEKTELKSKDLLAICHTPIVAPISPVTHVLDGGIGHVTAIACCAM